MTRYIVLITTIFCTLSYNAFADQVFYNKDKDIQIVDVSGKKTLEAIKKEFGEGSYEQATISSDESYRIKNKKIEVYNHVQENEQAKQDKENARKQKENQVKTKLNLSDAEFKALKESLE